VTPLLALLLTAGCASSPTSAADDCLRFVATGATSARVRLPGEEGVLEADLRWPSPAGPGGNEALTVVVEVPGGWHGELDRSDRLQEPLAGPYLDLHLGLVGGEWGAGEDDLRGPLARAALALGLRYAAGEGVDEQGCTLPSRVPQAQGVPMIAARSNGGNLAVATLADPALDLPTPAGLLLWETPAGAQFVNQELGQPAGSYEPGSCILGEDGVTCALPASNPAPGSADSLCWDLNDSGMCDRGEPKLTFPLDPVTGLRVPSPPLAARLATAGFSSDAFDDLDQALDFWAPRDAARSAPALAARFPELPVLLLASEVDHNLSTLPDHPHVLGLIQALEQAGQGWVRLNPGHAFTGVDQDNAPNADIGLDQPSVWLLPEDLEQPLGEMIRDALDELRAVEAGGDAGSAPGAGS